MCLVFGSVCVYVNGFLCCACLLSVDICMWFERCVFPLFVRCVLLCAVVVCFVVLFMCLFAVFVCFLCSVNVHALPCYMCCLLCYKFYCVVSCLYFLCVLFVVCSCDCVCGCSLLLLV